MILTKELPTLEELLDLIDSVLSYPITAGALTQLASAEGAGRRVIDFYQSFPADQLFLDEDDLISRSEQVLTLSNEEREQPWEEIRSPQE